MREFGIMPLKFRWLVCYFDQQIIRISKITIGEIKNMCYAMYVDINMINKI